MTGNLNKSANIQGEVPSQLLGNKKSFIVNFNDHEAHFTEDTSDTTEANIRNDETPAEANRKLANDNIPVPSVSPKQPSRVTGGKGYTISTYADATNLAMRYPELASELLMRPLSHCPIVLEDLLPSAIPPLTCGPPSTTLPDLMPRGHTAELPNWALAPDEPVIRPTTPVEKAPAAARQLTRQQSKRRKGKNAYMRMMTRSPAIAEEEARAWGPLTMADGDSNEQLNSQNFENSRRVLGAWNGDSHAVEHAVPSDRPYRDPPPHQGIHPSRGTSDCFAGYNYRRPVIVVNHVDDTYEPNADKDSSFQAEEWGTTHDPWTASAAVIDSNPDIEQPPSSTALAQRGGSPKETDDTASCFSEEWVAIQTGIEDNTLSRTRALSSGSTASWEDVAGDEWQPQRDPWTTEPPKPKEGRDPRYLQVPKAFKSRITDFSDWQIPRNLSVDSYDPPDSSPPSTPSNLTLRSSTELDPPCDHRPSSAKSSSPTCGRPIVINADLEIHRHIEHQHQNLQSKKKHYKRPFSPSYHFSFDGPEHPSTLVCTTLPPSLVSAKDDRWYEGGQSEFTKELQLGNSLTVKHSPIPSYSLPTSPTRSPELEPHFVVDNSKLSSHFDRSTFVNSYPNFSTGALVDLFREPAIEHSHDEMSANRTTHTISTYAQPSAFSHRHLSAADLTLHPRPSAAVPIRPPGQMAGPHTPDSSRTRSTPLSFFSISDDNTAKEENTARNPRSSLPVDLSYECNHYQPESRQATPKSPQNTPGGSSKLRASSPQLIPRGIYLSPQRDSNYLDPAHPSQEPPLAATSFDRMPEMFDETYDPSYVSPRGRSAHEAEVPEDRMSGSRRLRF